MNLVTIPKLSLPCGLKPVSGGLSLVAGTVNCTAGFSKEGVFELPSFGAASVLSLPCYWPSTSLHCCTPLLVQIISRADADVLAVICEFTQDRKQKVEEYTTGEPGGNPLSCCTASASSTSSAFRY